MSLFLTPVYVAAARVLLEDQGQGGSIVSALAQLPAGLSTLVGAAPPTASEVEVLTSRPVVTSVVLPRGLDEVAPDVGLNLLARVDDLALQSLWKVALRRVAGEPDPAGTLSVSVVRWEFPEDFEDPLVVRFPAAGEVELALDRWLDRRPARMAWRPGEELAYESARLVLASDVAPEALVGRSFRVTVGTLQKTVEDFLEALEVKEAERGSNVLRIAYPDADAERSAATVNALVQAYLAHNKRRIAARAGRPTEFLAGEIERVRTELASAEEDLARLGREVGVLALPDSAGKVVEKLAEIDLERARLELSSTATEEFLGRYDAGEISVRELAGLEAVLTSDAPPAEPLSALLARQRGLEALYNDDWPALREARAVVLERVAALRATLAARVQAERRLGQDLDSIQRRYLGQLEGLPEAQIELLRFQRKVEAFSQIYLLLVGQMQEAKIREATAVPAVEVIESALAPRKRSSPRLAVNLALGCVLGLVVGVVWSFAREARRPLTTAAQLALAAGAPPLGELPREREGAREPLFVRADPGGAAARAVRALRAALEHALSGASAPRRVAIVSSGAGEGRSGVAANLALALARTGARVLLVDADDAASVQARWFERDLAAGLAAVLSGADEAALDSGEEHLSFLAADTLHAGLADELAGRRGRAALGRLAQEHEWVLVDTAPLSESALALAVAAWCDGTLLVGRYGRTAERDVALAADGLRAAGARVLGTVLVGV